MSITLNNSDFQCLQDQLVDLKTKNYELAERNRRAQLDFEAAKAKICSLQLKLEEQERDFQLTSSTLRREIEAAYAAGGGSATGSSSTANESVEGGGDDDDGDDGSARPEDHRAKYKKLLHKARELQQRYERSVEVVQQMDQQIKALTSRANKLEEDNKRLRREQSEGQERIVSIEREYSNNLNSAIEEYKSNERNECQQHIKQLTAIRDERDSLRAEAGKLRDDAKSLSARYESLAEERKIQDKKGAQMLKELKRQLNLEKAHNETLQKRLESALSESTQSANLSTGDSDSKTQLSTSSNGHGSRGARSANNQRDDQSVDSWSLVAKGRTSTPSICSIESEDRETVQQQQQQACNNNNSICDTRSEQSLPQSPSSKSASRSELAASLLQQGSPSRSTKPSSAASLSQLSLSAPAAEHSARLVESGSSSGGGGGGGGGYMSGLKFEDQAALMDRVTRLQHDKWTLEEKLSYMEQANAALAQDLADKSQLVRQYFLDQAIKSVGQQQQQQQHQNQHQGHASASQLHTHDSSRRTSFPNNFNQLIAETPSLKKVVDFVKERGQVSSIVSGMAGESESVAREATRKMQLMLEETLIKCLKLQDNLDTVTSELNKLKS